VQGDGCQGRGGWRVFWPVVIEVGQRDGGIAGTLCRQVAVRLLVAAIGKRFAAFNLREEEAFADQFANHRQQWWQSTHSLNSRVSVQQRMAPIHATGNGPFA